MIEFITEDFLQFLWQYRLFDEKKLCDDENNLIEVISVGTRNYDAGPDFINARIKYKNIEWAGNVEIHVNSDDWNKHAHHTNILYNNVILHLVYNKTSDVKNSNGHDILTVKFPVHKKLSGIYEKLYKSSKKIACSSLIKETHYTLFLSFITSLAVSRLEKKASFIQTILRETNNNWEETFYRVIAYGFGLKVNANAFLSLTETLPLNVIKKHIDNYEIIEALFFGQSGLLPNNPRDKYVNKLLEIYKYYKIKYNLVPLNPALWKFSKLYPASFPTIRIAQFSAFLFKNADNLLFIVNTDFDLKKLNKLFDVKINDFWKSHYHFYKPSLREIKINIGEHLRQTIIINSILPFIFTYSSVRLNNKLNEKVLNAYEKIKPEKNNIIKTWESLNIKPKSALETQALIHLYENYCKPRYCLKCNIGTFLLLKNKSLFY